MAREALLVTSILSANPREAIFRGSDGGVWLPLSPPLVEKTAQISVFSEIWEEFVGMSEISEDSTWHAVGALSIRTDYTEGQGQCQAGC